MRITTCPGTSTEDVQAMKWFSISSIFAKVTSTYAISTPNSAFVINQSTWNKCQKDTQLSMNTVTSRPTGQSSVETGFHLASIANMIARRQMITGPIIVTWLPASPENSITWYVVKCPSSWLHQLHGNTVPSRTWYTVWALGTASGDEVK